MDKPKLLIADSNEDFRLALAKQLQNHYAVRCCGTGNDAYELLCQENWEVLVLDLMLPELDGLTLLERISEQGICPKALAFTPLSTDYILRTVERMGVGYVMLKPCDVQAAVARIHDLNQHLNPLPRKQDPEGIVSELLLSLQFAPKHKGFGYLKPAIMLLEKDMDQPITKVLYPSVAKICRCKSGHVERSIRSAIDAAWDHRDAAVWEHYFPGSVKRPTNAAFLTRLAETLRHSME